MTADDFRRIALTMQGAIERAHMGHPDFRANGRIFCTLHADDEWGTVMLTPEEQREFMRLHPRLFEPASGAWGRQGSTNVRLAVADEATVRAAIILAWQRIVEKPPGRPSRPAAARRPKSPRKR
jgi:YjbR